MTAHDRIQGGPHSTRPLAGRVLVARLVKRPAAKPPSERRKLALLDDLLNRRQCGACQACCVAIAVHEVKKPMYTPCASQCPTGCAVYKTRPESCRSYACAWRVGWLPGGSNGGMIPETDAEWAAGAELRPDRLRAIFDIDKAGESTKHYIRCWQLDGPDQIRTDPAIRQTAAVLAFRLGLPLCSYYAAPDVVHSPGDDPGAHVTGIHLIPPLGHWTGAFRRRFPHVPVYPLMLNMGDIA